jgi:hypothetical protein
VQELLNLLGMDSQGLRSEGAAGQVPCEPKSLFTLEIKGAGRKREGQLGPCSQQGCL